MKKLLFCTALLAALLAALPVAAADLATQPPVAPVKPEPEIVLAITAVTKELYEVIGDAKGHPIPILDKLAAHQFSSATKEQLEKGFGMPVPLTFARVEAPKGMAKFELAMPANSASNPNNLSWSALNMAILVDEAGRNMTTSGGWGSFKRTDEKTSFEISGMSVDGKKIRGEDDVWRGKLGGKIAAVKVSDREKNAFAMLMEGISFDTTTMARGKAYDVVGNFRIKAIKVMGEQVDGVRISVRATNLDIAALEQFSKAIQQRSHIGTPTEQLTDVAPQLKVFAKSLAQSGSALVYDELSAGYGGHRVIIKGRLSIAKSIDSDFDSMETFSKKIIARFNVRVPMPLLRAVARGITQKQAAAKGEHPSAASLDMSSRGLADMMVGQALASGYVRVDKDTLVADIEFIGGQLKINGKPLALPKMAVTPAAAVAPAPEQAPKAE